MEGGEISLDEMMMMASSIPTIKEEMIVEAETFEVDTGYQMTYMIPQEDTCTSQKVNSEILLNEAAWNSSELAVIEKPEKPKKAKKRLSAKKCVVGGCGNKSRDGYYLHVMPGEMPTNEKDFTPIQRRWISFIDRTRMFERKPASFYSVMAVCCGHFTADDYDLSSVLMFKQGWRRCPALKRDAVPSIVTAVHPFQNHLEKNSSLPSSTNRMLSPDTIPTPPTYTSTSLSSSALDTSSSRPPTSANSTLLFDTSALPPPLSMDSVLLPDTDASPQPPSTSSTPKPDTSFSANEIQVEPEPISTDKVMKQKHKKAKKESGAARTCIVGGCSNQRKDGYYIHLMPGKRPTNKKDFTPIQRRWISFIDRTRIFEIKSVSYYSVIAVCSGHFTADDYDSSSIRMFKQGLRKTPLLKRDAVPSVVSAFHPFQNHLEKSPTPPSSISSILSPDTYLTPPTYTSASPSSSTKLIPPLDTRHSPPPTSANSTLLLDTSASPRLHSTDSILLPETDASPRPPRTNLTRQPDSSSSSHQIQVEPERISADKVMKQPKDHKKAKKESRSSRRCIVGGCSNQRKDGYVLHQMPGKVPTKKENFTPIQRRWISFISRKRDFDLGLALSYGRILVCSAHFTAADYEPSDVFMFTQGLRKNPPALKCDAVPTVDTACHIFRSRHRDSSKSTTSTNSTLALDTSASPQLPTNTNSTSSPDTSAPLPPPSSNSTQVTNTSASPTPSHISTSLPDTSASPIPSISSVRKQKRRKPRQGRDDQLCKTQAKPEITSPNKVMKQPRRAKTAKRPTLAARCCIVCGTLKNRTDGCFLHTMPGKNLTNKKDVTSIQRRWIAFIKRKRVFSLSYAVKYSRIFVCSGHFKADDYEPSSVLMFKHGLRKAPPILKRGAVPSVDTACHPFPKKVGSGSTTSSSTSTTSRPPRFSSSLTSFSSRRKKHIYVRRQEVKRIIAANELETRRKAAQQKADKHKENVDQQMSNQNAEMSGQVRVKLEPCSDDEAANPLSHCEEVEPSSQEVPACPEEKNDIQTNSGPEGVNMGSLTPQEGDKEADALRPDQAGGSNSHPEQQTPTNIRDQAYSIIKPVLESLLPRTYRCPLCDQGFISKCDFSFHIKAHEEGTLSVVKQEGEACISGETRHREISREEQLRKPYRCTECSERFEFKFERIEHMTNEHFGTKPFKCPHCYKGFESEGPIMNIHFATHSDLDFVQCPECMDVFSSISDIQLHSYSHKSISKFMYHCPSCNFMCYQESDLVEHVESHLRTNKCKDCSAMFLGPNDLLEHKKTHIPVFQCPYCNAEFTCVSKFEVHKKTHQKPLHECSKCKETFPSKGMLTEHEKRHDPDYNCPECGFFYPFKKLVAEHVRKHKVPTYTCLRCSETFFLKTLFKEHMETHRQVYSCPNCDKTFTTKSTLAEHMKTHKPTYECFHCQERFPLKKLLYEHLKTHAAPSSYDCTKCDAKFASQGSLTKHTRSLHRHDLLDHNYSVPKGPPFRCLVCWKNFPKKMTLENHMKKNHPKENRCDIEKGSSDTATEEIYFQCAHCKKAIHYNWAGRTHGADSNGCEKDHFECSFCNRTFPEDSLLVQHMRAIHADGRRFKCHHCHKESLLMLQKPQCTSCKRFFVSENNLLMHTCVVSDDSNSRMRFRENLLTEHKETDLVLHMEIDLVEDDLIDLTQENKIDLVQENQTDLCKEKESSSDEKDSSSNDKPLQCVKCTRKFLSEYNQRMHTCVNF